MRRKGLASEMGRQVIEWVKRSGWEQMVSVSKVGFRYEPVAWLMQQRGLPATRARRLLGLACDFDEETVTVVERDLAKSQLSDGSFERSPMKTAGILNLLDDLRATPKGNVVEDAAAYLLRVLQIQPGYGEVTGDLTTGCIKEPCDLCGFFGPYNDRNEPEVMKRGAREMNFYREFEPLLGPKSPVRGKRRSSRDRPGPGSCYAWGLIPLAYIIEALCRSGYAEDPRLGPAIKVLLAVQRESGGWCRNLGGHPSCTIHAIRALGSHAGVRRSENARRALEFMKAMGAMGFAVIQASALFSFPVASELIRDTLKALVPRQQRNGTFGSPCRIERVAAALVAERHLNNAQCDCSSQNDLKKMGKRLHSL